MDLEKFYREDHAFYKFITGDFNAQEEISEFVITTKTTHGKSQFQKPSNLRWTWESRSGGYRNEIDHIIVNERFCLTNVAVVSSIRDRIRYRTTQSSGKDFRLPGEKRKPRSLETEVSELSLTGISYDRLVERHHDCTRKAENFKTTKGHLSAETLELIRQRGAARAAGNQELTPKRAKLSREEIKEHLKERSAESFAEVRGWKKHPLCPSRLRHSQDEEDFFPEPEGNNHCIEKGSEENHLRLLL